MIQWINKVWVKYINNLGFQFKSILFLDNTSMHLKDEIQSELINKDIICNYIPKGITGVMQHLDLCVEKIYLNGLMRFGILL